MTVAAVSLSRISAYAIREWSSTTDVHERVTHLQIVVLAIRSTEGGCPKPRSFVRLWCDVDAVVIARPGDHSGIGV